MTPKEFERFGIVALEATVRTQTQHDSYYESSLFAFSQARGSRGLHLGGHGEWMQKDTTPWDQACHPLWWQDCLPRHINQIHIAMELSYNHCKPLREVPFLQLFPTPKGICGFLCPKKGVCYVAFSTHIHRSQQRRSKTCISSDFLTQCAICTGD
jgi:hypothetical protein